ncbi:AI-2 transport protein TqsA [Parvularcula dongshanensis]|uniref:AI-2 transport protein TqsA n=1 Tax=Parvularcula dongshanensis TaxID=1173995 RepID=A0A840I2L0_9PROT|nr:AI-2 transport protein TqsA [Parvularcula dongshanensis]
MIEDEAGGSATPGEDEGQAQGVGHEGPVRRTGPSPRSWLIGVITVVLVGAALKATATITLPLALAFFVALVVWPIDGFVRKHAPKGFRWLGHLAAMGAILAVIVFFTAALYFVAASLADAIPDQARAIQARFHEMTQDGDGMAGRAAELFSSATGESASTLVNLLRSFAERVLQSLGMTLSLTTLVFFFALIMLTEAQDWRAKIDAVSGDPLEHDWFEVAEAAGQRFRWYLFVRTVLGLATALLYAGWLWAFGLDFVLVFGILTFLLGFVPTLGSLISGLLPFLFALATRDTGTALIIGAGLFVIEQVMGSYVDPKMQGRELSLSPLVILFSLLLWSFIWGIPGALIAVPMTVLIVIVLAHIDPLRPVALLLSGNTTYDGLDESVAPD